MLCFHVVHYRQELKCLIFLLGVNILKEFDALLLLETSVDNAAEENGVLWLNDVFTGVSLDDMIYADASITQLCE